MSRIAHTLTPAHPHEHNVIISIMYIVSHNLRNIRHIYETIYILYYDVVLVYIFIHIHTIMYIWYIYVHAIRG